VQVNDGFIAWPGAAHDARQFVPIALKQGASACLVEAVGAEVFDWDDLPNITDRVASYNGLKSACGPIAASFYQHPSAEVDVIAITGTNGKTSCAWWLAHALQKLGQSSSLVGTLGLGRPDNLITTGMTTPDPVLLQSHLYDMVREGICNCVMEASSIGIAEHRLDGTNVRLAMFTNFSQDHLDYHGDMDQYWQAKESLFDWPGLQAVVVNIDDPKGVLLANKLQKIGQVKVWTYATQEQVLKQASQHIQAVHMKYANRGMQFEIKQGDSSASLETTMVGDYNVSNLTGVIACLCALGHRLDDVAQACRNLPAIPGRMELLGVAGDPLVVVDFAHTPDAIEKTLRALQPLVALRGGDMICVLGCGGDRDKSKRPLMAAAAEMYAQQIVLTSDNPRSEDPKAILQDMYAGLKKPQSARTVVDRAQAIAEAVQHARPNDLVLIAGKGHETYQEILGVKYPFSDQSHVQQAILHRSMYV
jgi:UDP-N-acetylmuramoyl-L-alanyl-D-glutamate--2,6-diaminopimelate ligase